MKKFILIYDDDNHDKMVWFNREYVGTDLTTIAESMFGYGREEGEWSNTEIEVRELWVFDLGEKEGLTDDEIDIIHEVLCDGGELSKELWNAIIDKKWKLAIELCKQELGE